MTDIVERLRLMLACDPGREGRCSDCPSAIAADAVAEIEQLRVAVNDARNGTVAASECAGRMMEDRDEAFVEIERLREALTKIASQSTSTPSKMLIDYARAVIAQSHASAIGD